MPLPNADPDKRMYKLLKNIDLENLSFAQFQSTAQTVFAEPEAEDTLRRIVLINLARMSVAGDWNGLTTAASAGSFNAKLADGSVIDSTYSLNRVDATPPWGHSSGNNTQTTRNEPFYYPFIAPKTGNVSGIVVNITSAAASAVNLLVAIYSDDGGVPNAKMGQAVFDAEVSGQTEQTSLSATVSLVEGTQYWVGYVRSANVAFTMMVGGSGTPWCGPTENISSSWDIMWEFDTHSNELVDTITKTDLSPRGYVRVSVGLNI